MQLKATVLTGRFVQLEPIDRSHFQGLEKAARDKRIWEHTQLGPSFEAYFDQLFAARDTGLEIPFAVRWRATGELIGGTRYRDIVREHRRLEIGGTWYQPEYWAGPTNPEAKLLLLGHAFDQAAPNRVQLFTDVRNKRSQAAIAKLGARREGLLRSHMVVDGGRRRDSVLFSIVREEWPDVRTRLMTRLAAFETART